MRSGIRPVRNGLEGMISRMRYDKKEGVAEKGGRKEARKKETD